jgi:hypothetical protein
LHFSSINHFSRETIPNFVMLRSWLDHVVLGNSDAWLIVPVDNRGSALEKNKISKQIPEANSLLHRRWESNVFSFSLERAVAHCFFSNQLAIPVLTLNKWPDVDLRSSWHPQDA